MSAYTDALEANQKVYWDPMAKPWNDYSAAMSQLAMSNLQQRNKVQDLALANEYEAGREKARDERLIKARADEADADSKRRLQEFDEQERLRAINEAVKAGVPGITAKDTQTEVASKTRDYLKDKARAGLEIVDAQMTEAKAKQEQSMKALLSVSEHTGTLAQKKAALQAALMDPSAKEIPDKARNQIQNALDNARTPEEIQKAVDNATKAIQNDYWFFNTKGDYNKAKAFYDVYATELSKKVDPDKQLQAAAYLKQYEDSNRQLDDLRKQAWDKISLNAGLLDTPTIKDWTAKMGPPASPISLMPGRNAQTTPQAPPAPEPGLPSGIYPMGATNYPKPSAPPAPIYDPTSLDNPSNAVMAPKTYNFLKPSSNSLAFPPDSAPAVAQPAPAASNKALQASPQEVQAVQQLAATKYGVTPERLSAGAQAMQAGDPKAIQTFNQLLLEVRRNGMATNQISAPAMLPPDQGYLAAPVPTYGPQ